MRKYLFLILLLASYFSHAQTLTGTVKDSLGNPLANANVIAKPLVKKQGLKFSIADHFGRYKLEKETYLRYRKIILNIKNSPTLINVLTNTKYDCN
ncbi:hypothetical protein [Flavobacterium sp.]|uniref:hypothetical protein n=1 Tax=Flavobacterium sp. TaxID=239 RepID=UPI004048266F